MSPAKDSTPPRPARRRPSGAPRDDTPVIAWFVDIHGDAVAQHAHAADHLRVWATRLGADVLPVYGLRPADASAALGRDVPSTDIVSATRARLAALRAQHDLPGRAAPVVVEPGPDPDHSLDGLAARCAAAVKRLRPTLTFVHTHRRSTLGRLFLGSFSETLLEHLPGALLVVNPYAAVPPRFTGVTFATDFSDGSRQAFRRLLPIASALDVPIALDHHRTLRSLSVFMSGDATRAQQRAEVEADEARVAAEAAKYAKAAEKAGVAVSFDVRAARSNAQAADALVKRAKGRGDAAIALAARSRADGVRFGGLTRTLMRRADRPVLVLPIDAKRQ